MKPRISLKDILPAEMQLRDYVISVIKDTYRKMVKVNPFLVRGQVIYFKLLVSAVDEDIDFTFQDNWRIALSL